MISIMINMMMMMNDDDGGDDGDEDNGFDGDGDHRKERWDLKGEGRGCKTCIFGKRTQVLCASDCSLALTKWGLLRLRKGCIVTNIGGNTGVR